MTTRVRILFFLFIVSGFCGLIYESIWSHYLKLFLGHAAYAQTVVLVVFIGGLALGSWLAGHYAARLRRPLLVYAGAEFLVGVAALLFHRMFVGATSWAYESLLPAACSADHWCWAQWILAGVMILPQSVLLGTTFPLMSSGILRLDQSLPGRKLSLLYFLNSIGAVFGVLCSGYVLIPTVGLPGALFTAGIFNILLAIVVYFVDKNTQPARTLDEAASTPGATVVAAPARLLLAIALLTGLSSFIYEIAWVRSLSLVLGSSTHSFELMLASFILGLALGGLWIRKRIDDLVDTVRFLAIVQVVMGMLAVLTLPVYDATFDAMAWMLAAVQRSDAGWVMFNLTSAALALMVMLPATFMAGMTLPLITYTLLRSRLGERSIGHVYAANTLGGIFGVIIAVHLGLPLLGLKGTLILGGAIDVALGIVLLIRATQRSRMERIGWSGAGVALLVVAAIGFQLDPLKLISSVYLFGSAKRPSAEVVFHRDGKTASVDVFKHHGVTLSIATNGKVDGSAALKASELGAANDEHTMALAGALSLAHAPNAKTVAIIGFGTGITTDTVLRGPGLERVDTIEIEPAMIEGARGFGERNRNAYEDPRSHLVIDDAKSYFARSGRKYDVIISEPSNPWVSGVANLFTREFYQRVRPQLNEGGVLVQWVHTYYFNESLLASIVRALGESFPHLTVYAVNAADLVIVASEDGSKMALHDDVFRMPRLAETLNRLEIRRVEDLALRRVADQHLLDSELTLTDTAANSDYFPIVDTHASRQSFLSTAAKDTAEIATAPWPIVQMMTGADAAASYPVTLARWPANDIVREAERAEHARAYLLADEQYAKARAGLEAYYRPVSMFRARFIECRIATPPQDWRDAMIQTAGLVTVYLSPAASDAIWKRVASSRCYAALDPESKQWIELFRAAGDRDPAAMGARAEALLNGNPNRPLVEHEYLYGAAMTGLIAGRRIEDARLLFQAYHSRLPPGRQDLGWFRWMRSAVTAAPP